ncbi:MAG: hypothetical protein EPN91_01630 [Salinibacterium sp.]|nr:MAG: hypothetical protein EPN91_01630 [Salinibacterium sp.]
MNHYATLIRERWMAMAPASYAEISDKEQFFAGLGETMLTAVHQLTHQLTPTPASEDYLEQVGRLTMAKKQAEEIALSEVPWPAVEVTSDEAREEWESTRPQESGLAEWMQSLDRPLMEHELQELAAAWILPVEFLQGMSESTSPMTYLDSHSAEISMSQQLRYSRDLQNH